MEHKQADLQHVLQQKDEFYEESKTGKKSNKSKKSYKNLGGASKYIGDDEK